ncbi:MAG: ATP-dependent nuclease [Thermoplasmatota archaeon]
MAVIRSLRVNNFRGLKEFEWFPSPGLNCIIGPGDVGKSSVLSAIEHVLSARRSTSFTAADFHDLDEKSGIVIEATLGDLEPELLSVDAYGPFLRGFDEKKRKILDEPIEGGDEVLTVRLDVKDDLEPTWTLYSERTAKAGTEGRLRWPDRQRVAALRIGSTADYQLSFRQGSTVMRLLAGDAAIAKHLGDAARAARKSFGEAAKEDLKPALDTVSQTASNLGIQIRGRPLALLDPSSVSLSGGAIGLHDEGQIPLRLLGLGSLRLLIAGLQHAASERAPMVIMDEVEHGLEPHRVIRLLHALESKESKPTFQTFITTHSPVVIKELAASQLHLLRRGDDGKAFTTNLASAGDFQGPIRACPDAFLAQAVVVCEGATEIGLMRGFDLERTRQGKQSLMARGVALADGGGDNTYERALAFQRLGFPVAILRDSDKEPTPAVAKAFLDGGGACFAWKVPNATEDELFHELDPAACLSLAELAVIFHGADQVNANIQSASAGKLTMESLRKLTPGDWPAARPVLAKAAKASKWFKQIGYMETAAQEILAAALPNAGKDLTQQLDALWKWIDAE